MGATPLRTEQRQASHRAVLQAIVVLGEVHHRPSGATRKRIKRRVCRHTRPRVLPLYWWRRGSGSWVQGTGGGMWPLRTVSSDVQVGGGTDGHAHVWNGHTSSIRIERAAFPRACAPYQVVAHPPTD